MSTLGQRLVAGLTDLRNRLRDGRGLRSLKVTRVDKRQENCDCDDRLSVGGIVMDCPRCKEAARRWKERT